MPATFFEEIRKGADGAMSKAKLVFSRESEEEEPQQPDRLEELSEYCPTLTFQQVRFVSLRQRFTITQLTFDSA